jgi:hypothetical protein
MPKLKPNCIGNQITVPALSLYLALGMFTLQADYSPRELANSLPASVAIGQTDLPTEQTVKLSEEEINRLAKLELFKQLQILPQPIVKIVINDAGINTEVLNYDWSSNVNNGQVTFSPELYEFIYTISKSLPFDLNGDGVTDTIYGNIGIVNAQLVVKSPDGSNLTVDSLDDSQPEQVDGGAIIMGHRDSTSPSGAMNKLHNIGIGSIISITLQDGTVLNFAVDNKTTASKQATDNTKYQNILWVFSCDTGQPRPDGTYTTSHENSQNYGTKLISLQTSGGQQFNLGELGLG